MSDSTEDQVEKLMKGIQHLPRDMGIFSLCMRSLYAEKAVGTNAEAARRFRELRDDTRNDAMVYLKHVLPLSTKLVACIKDFFENYQVLDYEDWCKDLEDIRDEVASYEEVAKGVVEIHKELLVPLKKRGDQAKLVMEELKELQQEFERKQRELEKSASEKSDWAVGLFFIPFVNLIATPILLAESNKDTAEAVAQGAQAKIQEAAALAVKCTLIPALQSFIDGLNKAAGFFKGMAMEMGSFVERADKGLENKKKRHFMLMKSKAKEINSACSSFYAMVPVVETDLLSIPTTGIDQNYVDRWLEKQKRMIEESCQAEKAKKLARKWMASITGAPGRKAITS